MGNIDGTRLHISRNDYIEHYQNTKNVIKLIKKQIAIIQSH